MKEAFENKGSTTFLVCELQPGDQLEGVSLRALAHNKLQCFAAASFSQVGDTKYIRYNISGKTPASKLMGATMRREALLGMIDGIVGAMLSAEANQVAARTVMLDMNHIFANPDTGETVLICMPLMNAPTTKITVPMLCRNLLTNISTQNGGDGSGVKYLLDYLNGNPNPAMAEMKQAVVKAIAGVPQQFAVPQQPPVPTEPAPMPQPRTDKPMSMFYLLQNYNKDNAAAYRAQPVQTPVKPVQPPVQPVQPPVQPVQSHYSPKVCPQQPAVPQSPVMPVPKPEPDAGATTVLDDPGATTVLDPGMLSGPRAYLIRKKNGERIPITKDFFRIGKEKSFVDYYVSDNTAVSRAHAYILTKGSEYFIVDTNSTNHTYINGGMIPPNVETRLSHDTQLRLGNEEFEFRLL